jgi:hypothetical protein
MWESDAVNDPNKITANPAAKLTYDSPAISTYSPNTGYSAPSGNVLPGTSFAQFFPQSNGVYQAKPNPAPVVDPTPAPAPPAPPSGGRQAYNAMDAAGRASADESWLGGDSDYTAQLGEYDRALQDFINRITAQKQGFDLDADNAILAVGKNQANAGNQLGEDFGARGMSFSGLFDKSRNDLNNRFSEQKSNVENVRTKNKSDADNRLSDYQAENNIGRSNAKRSALTRMAAQQAMIDSNAGL